MANGWLISLEGRKCSQELATAIADWVLNTTLLVSEVGRLNFFEDDEFKNKITDITESLIAKKT